MVIELPAETEQQLRAGAAARGMDLNQYTTAVIHKGLDNADIADDLVWDDGQPMTEDEKAAIRAKVERAIADCEAGRCVPADEAWARLDAKYGMFSSEDKE